MDTFMEKEFSIVKLLLERDSDSESSSSSNDGPDIIGNMLLTIARKEKNAIKHCECTVINYSEEEFKRHFRVSKNLMDSLADRFSKSNLFLKHFHGK